MDNDTKFLCSICGKDNLRGIDNLVEHAQGFIFQNSLSNIQRDFLVAKEDTEIVKFATRFR